MSNFFEFGTCSLKLLFLILFPISSIGYGLLFKITLWDSHPFSDMLFKIIVKIFTGLLYLFPKITYKPKTNLSEPSSKHAGLFIVLIICLGLVDFIRLFFYDFPFLFVIKCPDCHNVTHNMNAADTDDDNLWKDDHFPQNAIKIFLENLDMLLQMICIILVFYLSQKMLKLQFGSYLKLSFLLIIIGSVSFIVYCIIWLVQNRESKVNLNLTYVFISLVSIVLTNLLRSVIEVWERYLMNVFFVSPFLITSVEGIIGMILYVCFMFIFGGTEYWKTLFSNEIYKPDNPRVVFTLIFIICQFIKEISRIQMNYHLTPVHRFGADILGSFVMIFFQLDDKEWYEVIIIVFGTICACIGFMILCEMIIIKVGGFGEDTQKSLANRGADERTELQQDLEIVQNESDEED